MNRLNPYKKTKVGYYKDSGMTLHKIHADVFLKLKSTVSCPVLQERAQSMMKTHKCFTEGDNSYRPQSKKFATQKASRPVETRAKVGGRVLSKEAIARKEFLMYANKLTNQNKQTIIKSFKSVIRKECVDIYMDIFFDIILRTEEYQDAYIEFALTIFDDTQDMSDRVEAFFECYNTELRWYPKSVMPDTIKQQDDYDDFCESQKHRKRAIAAIEAFYCCYKRGLLRLEHLERMKNSIFSRLQDVLDTLDFTAADFLLDQLLKFKLCGLNCDFARYKDCLHTFRPSTRFKILDGLA